MSNTAKAPQVRQTQKDRKYILDNLPEGTRRVQVINDQGKTYYKNPTDVDLVRDEIVLSQDGKPVVMRGKPGRKFKTKLLPPTPQIGEVEQARAEHLENSLFIKSATKDPEADEVLNAVVVGMAEEVAVLEFERLEAQRLGEEVSNLSVKRARVLKGMADTLLKRKVATQGGYIDLDSPQFKVLFSLLLETFKESMVLGGCRTEQMEQTFTRLVKALDDRWKEEARTRMKGTM